MRATVSILMIACEFALMLWAIHEGRALWREEVRDVIRYIDRPWTSVGEARIGLEKQIGQLAHAIDDLYAKLADLSFRTPV